MAHTIKRQDTFDLRDDILTNQNPEDSQFDDELDDSLIYDNSGDETQRSVIEEDEEDDDSSSQLSIPNESIDFDQVYSLRTFVATTEGQANVHKGDTLSLMDDTNSYWWLVRVAKTQEIGYIPAENIETPIERLARLNKHRNVDLASATPAEQDEDIQQARARHAISPHGGHTSDYRSQRSKSVVFTGSSVYYYPPFVWGDPARPIDDNTDDAVDEEDEGDYAAFEDADHVEENDAIHIPSEPDDGMSWEDESGHRIYVQPSNATQDRLRLLGAQENVINDHSIPSRTAQLQPIGVSEGAVDSTPQRLEVDLTAAPSNAFLINSLESDEPAATRKLSATPSIAREAVSPTSLITAPSPGQIAHSGRSLSISSTASGTSVSDSGGMKRGRDDAVEGDLNDLKRTKGRGQDRKLRKERSVGGESRDSQDNADRIIAEAGKEKKKGFLKNLFGRKTNKDSKIGAVTSTDADSLARSSMDSMTVSSHENTTDLGPQRQGLLGSNVTPLSLSSQGSSSGPSHQGLHQQYSQTPAAEQSRAVSRNLAAGQTSTTPVLSSSTLTPPSRAPRPGSLIISSSAIDGLSAAVPELSVLRVFAGDHLQSEATFKTVLINSSTTTSGLVRQAMQRFRISEGEDPNDYYLTIKQLDGDEAVLRPDERPLQAFEQLAERVPRISSSKRTSVGSFSSFASNLSSVSAINKLAMNDFTDDSTVKLYLHRSYKERVEEASFRGSVTTDTSRDRSSNDTAALLTVSTAGIDFGPVSPERFSSPSARFAIQVYIHPEDLPDGMVFDPHTEAIVPRTTLQHRSGSSAMVSPGVSQTQRRKIFVFPKNTTVAEVIEGSLERFGIVEGVVEGGDDVEDKPAKRRSASRVRYGLNVLHQNEQQRELSPSSKVLDAFHSPPLFKAMDRRSSEWRRRSTEALQILGSAEDVQASDPIFILRRAVGLRNSRSKGTGPLDELALRRLHRESASSDASHLSSSTSTSSQRTHRGQQQDYDSNQDGSLHTIEARRVIDEPSPSVYSINPQNEPSAALESVSYSRSTTTTVETGTATAAKNLGPIAAQATFRATERAEPPVSAPARSVSHQTQQSITSVLSDVSSYTTGSDRFVGALSSLKAETGVESPTSAGSSGMSRMLAIIELGAALSQPPQRPESSSLDEMFLGNPVTAEELHPRAREFFVSTLRDLESVGKRLDHLLLISQSVDGATK